MARTAHMLTFLALLGAGAGAAAAAATDDPACFWVSHAACSQATFAPVDLFPSPSQLRTRRAVSTLWRAPPPPPPPCLLVVCRCTRTHVLYPSPSFRPPRVKAFSKHAMRGANFRPSSLFLSCADVARSVRRWRARRRHRRRRHPIVVYQCTLCTRRVFAPSPGHTASAPQPRKRRPRPLPPPASLSPSSLPRSPPPTPFTSRHPLLLYPTPPSPSYPPTTPYHPLHILQPPPPPPR